MAMPWGPTLSVVQPGSSGAVVVVVVGGGAVVVVVVGAGVVEVFVVPPPSASVVPDEQPVTRAATQPTASRAARPRRSGRRLPGLGRYAVPAGRRPVTGWG